MRGITRTVIINPSENTLGIRAGQRVPITRLSRAREVSENPRLDIKRRDCGSAPCSHPTTARGYTRASYHCGCRRRRSDRCGQRRRQDTTPKPRKQPTCLHRGSGGWPHESRYGRSTASIPPSDRARNEALDRPGCRGRARDRGNSTWVVRADGESRHHLPALVLLWGFARLRCPD